MPSPRATRGRDFTTASLQFDYTDDHPGGYTRLRRSGRIDLSDGYPVQVRNGLPAPRYVYQGTGYCMSEAEAEYWLTEVASCLS